MQLRRATLLPLALLLSCAKPNLYQAKINDIPTKSPNSNAEVRFIGEGNPINPYFEIIDFELVKKGMLSKHDVQRAVEISAIKEGVDAIIEVDYWNESIKKMSVLGVLVAILEDSEPTKATVTYTHIRGLGILYLDNANYVHEQPEYEYFYKLDRETKFPTPFFKIEYKLTGQVFEFSGESDEADDIYHKYFKDYSDFHLLKQREGWSYNMSGPLLKNRIQKNRYGAIVKKCIPVFDENERLIRVKIVHFNSKIDVNEFINYGYDDEGEIIKRVVKVYDGTKIYENYLYENNRLAGKKIMVYQPSKEPIIINSSIDYYDKNYLEEFYFNEYVRRNNH